ncbi:WXG100 family type VII secretion target [Nocardia australiensis]|uniref:WXG100 family type VII secretion target n=1 Tax=Nocardia australiensis TaxID=2887191 RepID=UPI001D145ABD|nr:hypothetical protein [Nocardia australiensis]
MKYDYTRIYEHGTNLGSLLSKMSTNLEELENLRLKLLAEFTGQGAAGYKETTDQLKIDLDSFRAGLQKTNSVVQENTDLMNTTDRGLGNGFKLV